MAALARLMTRHGNRVGATLYSGQANGNDKAGRSGRSERVIPAKGGKIQVLLLINELLKQPRLPEAAFTDLKAMLEGALESIQKRSLVFILSDFISAPGWERPLSLLKQRHEVVAVRIWDPREIELPDVGPVWIEDSETGEQLYVDTHDAKFRAQFSALAQKRTGALEAAFRHAGVEAWSLSTEEDLVRAILRFASVRKQYHRIRGGSAVRTLTANSPRPEGSRG